MNRRRLPIALAVLAAVLFLGTLNRLFELRFAAGDIHPPSSSRRADPVGSRALRDALALQPGLSVSQNLEPLKRLRTGPGTTLLLLGVAPENAGFPGANPSDNAPLVQAARDGARVVIGFEHESARLATNAIRRGIRSLNRAGFSTNIPPPLTATLHFNLVQGLQAATNGTAERLVPDPSLPVEVPWTSPWNLSNLHSSWRAIYSRDLRVVAAERSFGMGSIVLLSSDYLLSNEALRHDPQPGLLSWMLGSSTRVIFDETHLGLSLEPGMAGLLRKYHLGGAALGLLLLAALHVWRTVVRFNPPTLPPDSDGTVTGRGSSAGLLSILRRSVPIPDLIPVCFNEWRNAQGRHPSVAPRRIADAQDLLNLELEKHPRQRTPVETYRRIAHILRSR
jgi:hypothetical protein